MKYRLKITEKARTTLAALPREVFVRVHAWLVDLAKDQDGHLFETVVPLNVQATSAIFLDGATPRRVAFFFDFDKVNGNMILVACRT